MKKKRTHKVIMGVAAALLIGAVMITGISSVSVSAAAKDKKAPTLTVQSETTDPIKKDLIVNVTAKDTSGISSVKWDSGSKSSSYFSTKGKVIKLNKGMASVIITKNGTYTFYARDKAGNTSLKKITVKNIDKLSPDLTVKASTTEPTNQSVKFTITAKDSDSGIASVQSMTGNKKINDFNSKADKINLKNGKATITVTKNGTLTILAKDKAGNETIKVLKINNIDYTVPVLNPKYSVSNQKALITVNATDKDSGIQRIQYIKGSLSDLTSDKWNTSAKEVQNLKSFQVTAAGKYSILAEDLAGNKTVKIINISLEMRAAWISFLDVQKYYTSAYKGKYSEYNFKKFFNTVIDNCVNDKMNTIIVQVRPFGDALYPSGYFPWNADLTGAQGADPGFDPLEIMVEAAHSKGLSIQAWLNPYRVAASTSYIGKLSDDNPAVQWMNSSDKDEQRNVIKFDGKIYYNPSKTEVQDLIVDGIKEIVENYDVDGIHFDDYFYPTLGSKYKMNFDAPEYNTYKKAATDSGKTALSIVEWRRENVNTLLRKAQTAIKTAKPNVVFGISPQANMSNLYSTQGHYTDVKLWMSSNKYIDYICPQIYWSFDHPTAAYDSILDQWISARTSDTVNIYAGIAVYKAGISKKEAGIDIGWATQNDVLKREIEYGRSTGKVDGYMFFRYEHMISSKTKKEMDNLLSILN